MNDMCYTGLGNEFWKISDKPYPSIKYIFYLLMLEVWYLVKNS
jgi:hypothetical protein